jgi:hypothetical protein
VETSQPSDKRHSQSVAESKEIKSSLDSNRSKRPELLIKDQQVISLEQAADLEQAEMLDSFDLNNGVIRISNGTMFSSQGAPKSDSIKE